MKIVGVIIALLFCSFASVSQITDPSWQIEVQANYGYIIKHTDKINFSVDYPSYGLSVSYVRHTSGNKAWHKSHAHTSVGVTVSYFNLGSPSYIGDAYSIMPIAQSQLVRRRKFKLNFRTGVGIGYLTKVFDRIENPINNAVGSNLNIAVEFRLGALISFNESYQLMLSGFFNHFSNGGYELPNFGINIAGVSAAFIFNKGQRNYNSESEVIAPTKKWLIDGHVDLALTETQTSGGPKHPIYIGSLGLAYRYNAGHQFLTGVEYENHRSIYNLGLSTFQFENEAEANVKATRLLYYIGHEISLGNIGVQLKVGTTISDFSVNVPYWLYTKLGIRYYLHQLPGVLKYTYIGGYLKAHKINAEYAAVGIGIKI